MYDVLSQKEIPDGEVKFWDGYLYILCQRFEDSEKKDYLKIKTIFPEYDPPVTLAEIKLRYPDVHMVIHDDWLHSYVYRYGNYESEGIRAWCRVGEFQGFA